MVRESFKDSYLKFTHLNAQFQIKLDSSDDSLLSLLPPEPSMPTASQLAVEIHKDGNLKATAFRIMFPFIVYDFADPQFGRLPQCNEINEEKLNKFELLVAKARECIIDHQEAHVNTNRCKESLIMDTVMASYYGTYDEIATQAQNFLGIAGLTDFHVVPVPHF